MHISEVIEMICTLICILSGIGAFFIFRSWPSNDPATCGKGICDILKEGGCMHDNNLSI